MKLIKNITTKLLFFLVFLSVFDFSAYGRPDTSLTQSEDNSIAFMTAIKNRVNDLDAAGKIHSNGLYPCDITDLVLSYIPIGTTFNDAEFFLKRAGFSVSPRQENPYVKGFYAVLATYDIPQGLRAGRTTISISLLPKETTTFDRISRINANVRRVTF